MSDATQILVASTQGDPQAASQLLLLVYDALRQLAAQKLAMEPPGQTLQPTALVHEAYLRLIGTTGDAQWDNRGHFFAAAAEAMQRILVENARARHSLKKGGDRKRIDLDDVQPMVPEADEALLALDEALGKLAKEHPEKAQLVKLRYYAGCTGEQAARHLGISKATAGRYWKYARAWLHCEIHGNGNSEQ